MSDQKGEVAMSTLPLVPAVVVSSSPPTATPSRGINRSGMTTGGTMASSFAPPSMEMKTPEEDFKRVLGTLPFRAPNITHPDQLVKLINRPQSTPAAAKWCGSCLCALTVFGACYLCVKTELIPDGSYGFSVDNGAPRILLPGWHLLASPLHTLGEVKSAGSSIIDIGPVTIVRIPEGSYGFATDEGRPELLLPGVHARNSTAFKFSFSKPLGEDLIEYGPIKLLTVRSGGVRVCYNNGRVQVYPEGRYAFNSGTFIVAGPINTQQQSVRFEEHPVLLDGGITLLVEGLLIYQVVDVEQLVKELGDRDLLHAIKDVTKAELSRVFASLHLEQISSAHVEEEEKQGSMLGKGGAASGVGGSGGQVEGELATRTKIRAQVIQYITPLTANWGVRIVDFHLESTKIADQKYAREYEEASLGLAKAKANRRAVDAESEIQLRRAAASADALKIQAEAKKVAVVIEAMGDAEARTIEARARNEAGRMLTDGFARQYAMAGQQVEFARGLQAKSLTILSESAVGRPMLAWAAASASTYAASAAAATERDADESKESSSLLSDVEDSSGSASSARRGVPGAGTGGGAARRVAPL